MNEHPSDPNALPRSVLFVAIILIAFVSLLALEVSDSFFKHNGQIARSLFVLPVVILLLRGLLTRRRWAWWVTRVIAILAAILYTVSSVSVWLFFAHLQIGLRVWISAVGTGLLALVVSVYVALGRESGALLLSSLGSSAMAESLSPFTRREPLG